MSTNDKSKQIIMDKLESVLDVLEHSNCIFWACEGPDVPYAHMKTCSVCSSIQDLRVVIKLLKERFK